MKTRSAAPSATFDLSVRNMNLGELAYGTEKARNLFREMIQRAANEVGFEPRISRLWSRRSRWRTRVLC